MVRKRFWMPLVLLAFVIGMAYMAFCLVQGEASVSPPNNQYPQQSSEGQLKSRVEGIAQDYHNSHTYIVDETVCRHMVAECWNMLYTQGIEAKIAIGNLEMKGEDWKQSDHAWLLVNVKGSYYLAVEVTNGQVYDGGDLQLYPRLAEYWEPYQWFDTPSEFRKAYGANW